MENYIIFAVLAVIVGGALFYLLKEKKKGNHCVGCPHFKVCGKCGGGSCGDQPAKKRGFLDRFWRRKN